MTGTVEKDIPRRLLSPEQAGVYINASAWTVRQMVRSGKLPHVPRGRKIYLDRKDLDVFIERTKVRDEY